MWAAEMGHLECAEALIEYGTDVGLAECNGRCASMMRVHQHFLPALKWNRIVHHVTARCCGCAW